VKIAIPRTQTERESRWRDLIAIVRLIRRSRPEEITIANGTDNKERHLSLLEILPLGGGDGASYPVRNLRKTSRADEVGSRLVFRNVVMGQGLCR
jgi:hypothetical protein